MCGLIAEAELWGLYWVPTTVDPLDVSKIGNELSVFLKFNRLNLHAILVYNDHNASLFTSNHI